MAFLARESLEQPLRFRRCKPVGLFPIGRLVSHPAQRGSEVSRLADGRDAIVRVAVVAARVDDQVPRSIVIQARGADVGRHTVVIELADTGHEVAVAPVKLRPRHGFGELLAQVRRHQARVRRVGEHAGRVRPASRQEGRPAGIAQRELRVGAVEAHAARGEGVDVRRVNRGTVRAQVHVEVVGDDQKNVGGVRSRGWHRSLRADQRRHEQHQQHDEVSAWHGAHSSETPPPTSARPYGVA
jgi:hypothetical protein